MVNTLDKIIEEKKNSLNKFKKTTTLDSLEKNIFLANLIILKI